MHLWESHAVRSGLLSGLVVEDTFLASLGSFFVLSYLPHASAAGLSEPSSQMMIEYMVYFHAMQ